MIMMLIEWIYGGSQGGIEWPAVGLKPLFIFILSFF
jgi:hypothetical protein